MNQWWNRHSQTSRWLNFELHSQKGKTQVWWVLNKSSSYLGSVSWYPTWRQYAFFPMAQTVLAGSCISDLAEFVTEANERHKQKSK